MSGSKASILFTGYAPVHYACFRPLHAGLDQLDAAEVFVSGGLRSRDAAGEWVYDTDAMYGPFGLPPTSVLTVEEIRERDFDVLLCANTKKIAPRTFGRSVEIFHGMSFRNRAVRGENAGNDHYFALGPYMRRAFERLGIFAPGDRRLVSIGFPKTDRLLNGGLDREAILRRAGISGGRPVVLYAPTGAKRNSLETFGEEVLRRLKATGLYDILVKLHDHPKNRIDWSSRLAPLEDEHLRVLGSPDVIESLFVADLLISDASSVSNEYALLDRPMVFLDVPELIAAAGGNGSALDLDTWGRKGGQVAADPEAAVRAVAEGLEHPERRKKIRQAMVEDLFYNPGHATAAALAWMRRELSLS
jgi:hypothetical protein